MIVVTPMSLLPGTIKRLHVNQQRIRQAMKTGDDLPTITVQTSKGPWSCRRVTLVDRFGDPVAQLIQQLDHPLACGARVFIETKLGMTLEP